MDILKIHQFDFDPNNERHANNPKAGLNVRMWLMFAVLFVGFRICEASMHDVARVVFISRAKFGPLSLLSVGMYVVIIIEPSSVRDM